MRLEGIGPPAVRLPQALSDARAGARNTSAARLLSETADSRPASWPCFEIRADRVVAARSVREARPHPPPPLPRLEPPKLRSIWSRFDRRAWPASAPLAARPSPSRACSQASPAEPPRLVARLRTRWPRSASADGRRLDRARDEPRTRPQHSLTRSVGVGLDPYRIPGSARMRNRAPRGALSIPSRTGPCQRPSLSKSPAGPLDPGNASRPVVLVPGPLHYPFARVPACSVDRLRHSGALFTASRTPSVA